MTAPEPPPSAAAPATGGAMLMAAGALVRDRRGRILLVEPTYQAAWQIPGGAVEPGETPWQACIREVHEELGLHLRPGRLLVLDQQPGDQPHGRALRFVYDGGVLDDPARIRLPADELASYRFTDPSGLDGLVSARLAARVRAALAALADRTGTGPDIQAVWENAPWPHRGTVPSGKDIP